MVPLVEIHKPGISGVLGRLIVSVSISKVFLDMILVVLSFINSKRSIANWAIQISGQMSLHMHLQSFDIVHVKGFFANGTFRSGLFLCHSSSIIRKDYSFLRDSTDNAGFLPVNQIRELILVFVNKIFGLFLYDNRYIPFRCTFFWCC